MLTRIKSAFTQTDLESEMINYFQRISTQVKLAFFSALIFSVLTHSFGFSSKFINEDSIFYHFADSMSYLFQSGRWALVGLQYIRGFHIVPWLIGVFALFYLSLAVAFLVSLLEIKNKIHVILISAIIVTFPAWTNQFMHDFMADAYPAAMFLAVLSIYLTKKYRFGFIGGAFTLMLSMALYQSFLAFAIGLALMVVMRYILENERTMKEIVRTGLKYLFCGILGVIFYLISIRVSLWITGGALWAHQGIDELGQFGLRNLPTLLRTAYDGFFAGFRQSDTIHMNQHYISRGLSFLYWIVFALIGYLLVRLILSRRGTGGKRFFYNFPALITLSLCLLFLPLGLNITRITAPGADFHAVMTNPFLLMLVLPFPLFDLHEKEVRSQGKKPGLILGVLLLATTVLISGSFQRQTASFQLTQHIQYEHTMAFYNRLLLRIEETPGYAPGVPVAFIATFPFEEIGDAQTLLNERTQIVGFWHHRPFVGLGEPVKMQNFIQNYLGVHLTLADWTQVQVVLDSEAFAYMPPYPRSGSVAMIGDVLVVKF